MLCLYSVVVFSFASNFKADTKENENNFYSIEWSSDLTPLGKNAPQTSGRLEKIPALQTSYPECERVTGQRDPLFPSRQSQPPRFQ